MTREMLFLSQDEINVLLPFFIEQPTVRPVRNSSQLSLGRQQLTQPKTQKERECAPSFMIFLVEKP